jgi:glycosyltransferase involved in cell wall biosynthesis
LVELKGAGLLIQSLPAIVKNLKCCLSLDLIGDGPHRGELERKAIQASRNNSSITINFHGWLKKDSVGKLLKKADLLVIPSLWPEPFGMVGLEAGRLGIPSVAFDVGGISDWLKDGVNGHLISSELIGLDSLVFAISDCLGSIDSYRKLSIGARREASKFTIGDHVSKLLHVMDGVLY